MSYYAHIALFTHAGLGRRAGLGICVCIVRTGRNSMHMHIRCDPSARSQGRMPTGPCRGPTRWNTCPRSVGQARSGRADTSEPVPAWRGPGRGTSRRRSDVIGRVKGCCRCPAQARRGASCCMRSIDGVERSGVLVAVAEGHRHGMAATRTHQLSLGQGYGSKIGAYLPPPRSGNPPCPLYVPDSLGSHMHLPPSSRTGSG